MQISQHWLRQCFLNYLDWPEVSLYISAVVVMGTDYQVCTHVRVHVCMCVDTAHGEMHYMTVGVCGALTSAANAMLYLLACVWNNEAHLLRCVWPS